MKIDKLNGLIANFIVDNDILFADLDVTASIDISHIDNFYETLEKLSNFRDSPIDNDGFTGIDIFQANGGDLVEFIIDVGYVFGSYKNVTINFLKENCDIEMVEDIISKVLKLDSLGFSEISITYSYFTQQEYRKHQEELKIIEEEDNEGHYSINDYPILSEE